MKRVLLFTSILMMAAAMNAWAAECADGVAGKYGAITIATDGDKCVATLDPESTEDVNIPDDVTIDQFVYDRDFKTESFIEGEKSTGQGIKTICFPFSGSYTGGSLFEVVGIEKNWKWQIIAGDRNRDNIEPRATFEAGVPYFVVATDSKVTFTPTSPINTSSLSPVKFGENNEWEFRGTYTYKKWEDGDPQIGHVYGFAAKEKDNVKAGQFVKVKAGAYIKPMRAYLYYNKQALARRGALAKATDDEDLPSTIEVVFKDKNGVIASIHRMDPVTGAITPVEGWYDMKGRKLNKKPTLPGTYFNNGEKVIIK